MIVVHAHGPGAPRSRVADFEGRTVLLLRSAENGRAGFSLADVEGGALVRLRAPEPLPELPEIVEVQPGDDPVAQRPALAALLREMTALASHNDCAAGVLLREDGTTTILMAKEDACRGCAEAHNG